jgi:carbon storage regulator
MLILSRKIGERIIVPDCGLTITVVGLRGNRVRLGIVAPPTLRVDREEVWQRANQDQGRSREASSPSYSTHDPSPAFE